MADVSLLDVPYNVALALSLASSSTGADYDYLLKTAQRESAFQADARASTSSAQGLFQFIEETWIRTIKDDGPQFGLSDYADRITITDQGRYVVASAQDRTAILALRNDPHISAMMAGVYARRNADFLASEIGRKPTSGELYIAHFLGPTDAARLIALHDKSPELSAPTMFAAAAKANRPVFYEGERERSIGEVYDRLTRRPGTRSYAAAGGGASVLLGEWDMRVQQVFAGGAGAPSVFGSFWARSKSYDGYGGSRAPVPEIAEAAPAEPASWDVTVSLDTERLGLKKPEVKKPVAQPIGLALRGSVADTGRLLADAGADKGPAIPALADAHPLIKIIRVSSQ